MSEKKKHIFVYVDHEPAAPGKLSKVGIAYSKTKPLYFVHELDSHDFFGDFVNNVYKPDFHSGFSGPAEPKGYFDACGFTGHEGHTGFFFSRKNDSKEERIRFFYCKEFEDATVSFVASTVPLTSKNTPDCNDPMVTKDYLRQEVLPYAEGKEKEFLIHILDAMEKKFWF